MTEQDYQEKLRALIRKQERRIKKLYAMLANEAAISIKEHKVKSRTSVWFRNKRIERKLDAAFRKFQSELADMIKFDVRKGWDLANKKNTVLLNSYMKNQNIKLPEEMEERMRDVNEPALRAFELRRRAGMSISGRVWNIAAEAKEQLELYLADGIHEGTPATKLAGQIKQFLLNPDKRFRRVRDPKTGKLKLSKPARNYHPGRGVYRSSYKNALRLAGTETNMAYNQADYLRRRELFFIRGIRVNLAWNHPRYDICDELEGDYPKEFLFTGWHPQCLCFTTSIQMPKEEFLKYLRGEEFEDPKLIKGIPFRARRYINKFQDKYIAMKNKPYWLTNNFNLVQLSKFDPDLVNYALKPHIGTTSVEEVMLNFADPDAVEKNIFYGKAQKLDTMGMFTDSNGKWLPEREALHEEILKELLAKKSTVGGVNIWSDPKFLEWQKGNKVVNEFGEPILLYHGSDDQGWRFKSYEKFQDGDIIKVYRGRGNNFMEGMNEGFFWVTESEEYAREYASIITAPNGVRMWNVDEMDILKPRKVFEFPFSGSTEVRGMDMANILRLEVAKLVRSADVLSSDEEYSLKRLKEYLKTIAEDDTLQAWHSHLNGENAKTFSYALRELGFDAVKSIEKGNVAYGILNNELYNTLAVQEGGMTFFTNSIGVADSYRSGPGEMKKAFVKMTNPLIVGDDNETSNWNGIPWGMVNSPYEFPANDNVQTTTNEIVVWAKEHGYDGVIFKNTYDYGPYSEGYGGASDQYVIFDPPTQIWEAEKTMYMMGGAPANGKSTVLESDLFKSLNLAEEGDNTVGRLAVVNSDEIKNMLPEYKALQKNRDKYAAAFTHEESSYLSKRYIKELMWNDYDFMLDGVNDGSLEKVNKKVKAFQFEGYKVVGNYCTLDSDLSIKLAKIRSNKVNKETGEFEGRYVPLGYVAAMNRDVTKMIKEMMVTNKMDEFYLWDTNTIGKPKLIMELKKGYNKVKIYDKKLWNDFLRKENFKYYD